MTSPQEVRFACMDPTLCQVISETPKRQQRLLRMDGFTVEMLEKLTSKEELPSSIESRISSNFHRVSILLLKNLRTFTFNLTLFFNAGSTVIH